MNPPSPLVGFNNNFRYKGRMFHIQTEDSGVKHARVVTHLFVDGGRIVHSTKTTYNEHVGRADYADVVRDLMRQQHKAMAIALKEGRFDHLLLPTAVDASQPPFLPAAGTAPVPQAPAPECAPEPTSGRSIKLPPVTLPPMAVAPAAEQWADDAVEPVPSSAFPRTWPVAIEELERAARSVERPFVERLVDLVTESSRAIEDGPGRYTKARSDRPIRDQSLDEVILSYLADDINASE